MVGFYYNSTSGVPKAVSACSTTMNGHGWSSSWRAQDADEILWYAADPPGSDNWLFPALPAVFIIDTSTMVIEETFDPLGDAQDLND